MQHLVGVYHRQVVGTYVGQISTDHATLSLLGPPSVGTHPIFASYSGLNAGAGSLYIVVEGDTCYKIAKANNITLKDLKAANPKAGCGPTLQIGTVLTIPKSSEKRVLLHEQPMDDTASECCSKETI